jgi:hypothetical protein
MAMRAAAAIPLVLILAAAQPAPARADVRQSDGSPLPALDEMAVLREPGSSRRLEIRVAYQGLRPTELPRPAGLDNPEVGGPIGFLEPFACSMTSGSAAESYDLLVKVAPDGLRVHQVVGWVARRYLIVGTLARQDPATKLLQKALISTSPDQFREAPAPAGADPESPSGAVTPRLGPAARSGTAGEPIRLFNVFFIYGEADGYVLIGRRPLFRPEADPDDPRRVILGWVPENRICRWLTREAVSWRPEGRKKAGVVYGSAQDALNGLFGRPAQTILIEEPRPDGLFGRPLLPGQMRFPLIGGGDPGDRTPGWWGAMR